MKQKTAFRSIILVVCALIIAPAAAHATSPAPDLILIPIVASHARDATGAVWSSTVFFNYTLLAGPLSVSDEPILDYRSLLPGERGVLDIHTDKLRVGPGVMILTYAFGSKQLYIQSYVYNEAKPEVGVSIPAVRLSDLNLGQPVRLVGIPLNAESRTLVRVYAITDGTDADVLVRVSDATGHVLAVDTVHLFSTPVLPLHSYAAQPAYGEYRPSADPTKYPSISIDIESLTPPSPTFAFSSAIWAFSTTTGARSENVTAVFPAQ